MELSFISLKNKTFLTVTHLFERLIRCPLLLGWIVIGTIIEILLNGLSGFIITIINLTLLALFTTIIKIMTDNSQPKATTKLKHPKLELAAGVLLLIFIFTELSIIWGIAKIPYLSTGSLNIINSMQNNISKLSNIGIPEWVLSRVNNASFTIVFMLIPTIILFVICGYGFRKMGFVFKNLRLILILLSVTIILGLPYNILFQQPLHKTIITFFIMIFINGLPEELFFRGFLLPRFEKVLGNSINALVIVAVLFNILHIPSYLSRGLSVSQALLTSLSVGAPTGLIWGYLYLKTRSIVPGVIWHTSTTILGIIFIGI